MRWNSNRLNDGFCPSHFTKKEISSLAKIGYLEQDARCFLEGAVQNTLHPSRISFKDILKNIENGIYGEVEGAYTRYAERHFSPS
jgi:hypothetical protein